MKRFVAMALAVVVTGAGYAFADEASHRKLAEELLTTMNVQKQLERSFDMVKKMIPGQINKMQQAAGGTNAAASAGIATQIMDRVFTELSWDKCKDDYITMYADTFTDEELKGIMDFYKSPAGQKMLDKQPELMRRSMELNQKRMMDLMPFMQSMGMGKDMPGRMRGGPGAAPAPMAPPAPNPAPAPAPQPK